MKRKPLKILSSLNFMMDELKGPKLQVLWGDDQASNRSFYKEGLGLISTKRIDQKKNGIGREFYQKYT